MSKPSLPKELQGLLRQNSALAPLAKAARGRKAAAPKGPAAPPQDCLPPALRDPLRRILYGQRLNVGER